MTTQNARKALTRALKISRAHDEINKLIKYQNNDTKMLEGMSSSFKNLDIAIKQLCKIVPNAEALLLTSQERTRIFGAWPETEFYAKADRAARYADTRCAQAGDSLLDL